MREYENPEFFHQNLFPPHANYWPESPDGAQNWQSLNGTWQFALTDASSLDRRIPDECFSPIPVPSNWELHGYERPLYSNKRYPFPVDPPYVPEPNPVGIYRRLLVYEPRPHLPRTFMRLDGAATASEVWLNDNFVGYAQGSRIPREFELTQLLQAGENRLEVRIYKYSTGSYLEDQDMWRLHGLFRDVSLIHRPQEFLQDIFIHADYDAATGNGMLSLEPTESDPSANTNFMCILMDKDGNELWQANAPAGQPGSVIQAVVPKVKNWTAETPYLYTLKVSSPYETLRFRVGFRTVVIEGHRLLVNGQSVKLRGVNRHEMHPETGQAISRESMLQDVLLMKQNNINTVRSSHYNPHPYFLELCDQYGLYLICEADLETHGFDLLGDWGQLSRDAAWQNAYLDRVKRLVEQNKNHVSVIIWSLGNESGMGANIEAMAAWLRQRDPSRPIHYEGAYDHACVDIVSEMYPTVERVAEQAANAEDGRPYFICEFAHAMGNAPGNMQEYWDLVWKHERLLGGCIWDWADQGLLAIDPEGCKFLAYGGDFGDYPNDSNFCINGLVGPYRDPHPSLFELKHLIQPIVISSTAPESGTFTLTSRFDHAVTQGLSCEWQLWALGQVLAQGTVEVNGLGPRANREFSVELPTPFPTGAREATLNFRISLDEANAWAPAGHELAKTQFILPVSPELLPTDMQAPIIGLKPVFSAQSEELITLSAGDEEILVRKPKLQLFRAPTDNDMQASLAEWHALDLEHIAWKAHSCTITPLGLDVQGVLASPGKRPLLSIRQIWQSEKGWLRLELRAEPLQRFDRLPRLGWQFSLPPGFNRMHWYGLGPHEAYQDRKSSAMLGQWSANLEELHTPYVKPQENGNRFGVRWACLQGPDGKALFVASTKPFETSLHRYTPEKLASTAHDAQIEPDPYLTWHIDYEQSGLGNASCGPDTLPQYRFGPQPINFRLVFAYLDLEKEDPWAFYQWALDLLEETAERC